MLKTDEISKIISFQRPKAAIVALSGWGSFRTSTVIAIAIIASANVSNLAVSIILIFVQLITLNICFFNIIK